jgi:hypothetical protein
VRAGVASLVAVALLIELAKVAWAENTPLDVNVEAGAGVESKALEGHLAVELDRASAPQRVEVARQGASLRVRLVYADESDERLVVDVTDVSDAAAPRVLALAIGEAARLHVARPERAPPAPSPSPVRPANVTPPAPSPTSPAPTSTLAPAVGMLVSASLSARAFGAAGTVGFEPRLAIGLVHRSGFVAEVGGAYFAAGASDPLGDVRLHAVGASLAVAYERALASRVFLRMGPRLDVGAAFGSGTPTGTALASSTSGALVSLIGEAVVSVRLGARNPWLLFAIDAGGVLRGIDLRADDRTPLAARGPTFGGRLGLGFR